MGDSVSLTSVVCWQTTTGQLRGYLAVYVLGKFGVRGLGMAQFN
jgi:hypothetical protein